MKFTGRYTAATAKALKGSPRLVCQVSEDGTIYVCNGFLLCTMNAPEYAATVQGFTCCEPGNWTIDKDGKHEDDAHKLDLVRLYADTLKTNADAQPLQRSPLTVQTPKAAAVCYYNAAAEPAASPPPPPAPDTRPPTPRPPCTSTAPPPSRSARRLDHVRAGIQATLHPPRGADQKPHVPKLPLEAVRRMRGTGAAGADQSHEEKAGGVACLSLIHI